MEVENEERKREYINLKENRQDYGENILNLTNTYIKYKLTEVSSKNIYIFFKLNKKVQLNHILYVRNELKM